MSPLLWGSSAALLVASLVLGGGTRHGLWSDAFLQLASLALLAVLATPQASSPRSPARLWPALIIAAAILLSVAQLIPLPPTWWTALPGRSSFALAYDDARLPLPWLPVSLDPRATLECVLSLLPAIAVYLAVARLDSAARRSLSLLMIGFGMASVLLGLAQLMQGPDSILRFHPITNPGNSVGFFANRNHHAALLYSLIPVAAAWMVGLTADRRPERILGLVLCTSVYAALILGIGMSLSRAGIMLAAVATFASLVLAARHQGRLAGRGLIVVLAASTVGVLLVVQFALFGLLDRLDGALLSEFRFRMAAITIDAARVFQPIGSGFGTFESIYRMFETPDVLLTSYVNHAHNDWLELWLEGGWPAIGLAIAFLAWALRAGAAAWRAEDGEAAALDRALAQAATVTIVALLLHSAMDYPLRTTAVMVVFAFSCALLAKPPRPALDPVGQPLGSGISSAA
ncbi:MAG: O-antigen ligase family protein [Bauldia sp.]